MDTLKHILLQLLIDQVAPVFGLLLTIVFAWAMRLLFSKIKNERIVGILTRLHLTTDVVVKSLLHRTRTRLLEASEDGRITPNELAEIKSAAIADVKDYLGTQGLKDLGRVVDADAIEKALLQSVERALHDAMP